MDVWFEFHNVEKMEREGLTEWLEWLAKQPLVFMQQGPTPRFPLAKKYPIEAMIARYGRYWWTSSIAYMMAAAMDQKPKTIGIYGVDMAANTEYNQQRLACQFFMLEAVKQGIEIFIPPESDLLEPSPMYGYCESNRQWRKYQARLQELHGRIASLREQRFKAENEEKHLIGAADDLEYNIAHWANRPEFTA